MNPAPFIIVRGASGAGKSTFSRMLQQKLPNGALIFETDNFFVDSVNHRDYHFDPELLGIAHVWNQGEVIRACRDYPAVPVIVANTFCSIKKEVQPYLDIARTFNRSVYVYTLLTKHENVHGVPNSIVQRHRDRLELFVHGYKPLPNGIVYSALISSDKEADYCATAVSQWLDRQIN